MESLIELMPDDTGVIRQHQPSRWQWVLSNALFLAVLCALGGPGMSTGSEPLALGILAAVCFLGPMRAGSALLEWYLVRQYRHRAIVVSHLVALGIGAMLGTSPPSAANPTGTQPIAGWALAVFGYVLIALICLCAGAALAFLRARRRGGGPPSAQIDDRWSLSALPALFWFNAVFIVAVALLIAPSMAAQEKSSLMSGFTGGLLVGVVLRLPGAWAEWGLTKHSLHRAVYGVHLGAGLLTTFVMTAATLSPGPGMSSTAADTAGGAIGVYLFLSSVFLIVTAVVVVLWRNVRRGRDNAGTGSIVSPVSPPEIVPPPGVPVYRAAARVPERLPAAAHAPEPSPAAARVPEPSPTAARADAGQQSAEVPPESPDRPLPPTESANRTEKVRTEIGLALGIVVGVASLVQGYDSSDPFRTVVVALAIGFISLGIIYGTTIRR